MKQIEDIDDEAFRITFKTVLKYKNKMVRTKEVLKLIELLMIRSIDRKMKKDANVTIKDNYWIGNRIA